ncbi:hypothetical protein ACQP1W_24785 [Spirillospora sp. CA-255316]
MARCDQAVPGLCLCCKVGGDAVASTEPDASSIAAALEELIEDPERRETLADVVVADRCGS